jgi:hypothetical protein
VVGPFLRSPASVLVEVGEQAALPLQPCCAGPLYGSCRGKLSVAFVSRKKGIPDHRTFLKATGSMKSGVASGVLSQARSSMVELAVAVALPFS